MSTVNNMDKHPFKPKIADYTQISADNGISHAVQLYCGWENPSRDIFWLSDFGVK